MTKTADDNAMRKKILIFIDFDVTIRHFVQSNAFAELEKHHDVTYVFHRDSTSEKQGIYSDIAALGITKKNIKVVLNNRIRSDTQLPSSQVQAKLEHEILSTLTPAPELFVQATRVQTPAVLCQPESLTARQIQKLVEFFTEREALPR